MLDSQQVQIESIKQPHVMDIDQQLRYAKDKLHNAIWEEDEELQQVLQRQINRLEMLKAVGERFDVDH